MRGDDPGMPEFQKCIWLCALSAARRAEKLGAGEIVLNSIDADGTKAGFDIEITRRVSESVGIPVVASGGAGKLEHMADVRGGIERTNKAFNNAVGSLESRVLPAARKLKEKGGYWEESPVLEPTETALRALNPAVNGEEK